MAMLFWTSPSLVTRPVIELVPSQKGITTILYMLRKFRFPHIIPLSFMAVSAFARLVLVVGHAIISCS